MEILRWTGRPRMALINKIGGDDHVEEWRRALSQYFNVVRMFDAHRSGFAERRGHTYRVLVAPELVLETWHEV